MSSALLERSPASDDAPLPSPRSAVHLVGPGETITVHGDFGCPLSHLAFRRATVLAQVTDVDWHAVETAPWTPTRHDDRRERLDALAERTERAVSLLLPGEELPRTVPTLVPRTRPAVVAYAEAYAAGIATTALRMIFDAFWSAGADIGDPTTLRLMLRDELRGGASVSEVVRESGFAVDLTGGPMSNQAWRLVERWRGEWQGLHQRAVPVLQVPGGPRLHGEDAVEWLGRELLARGLATTALPDEAPAAPYQGLPGHSWVSGFGGRWLERSQRSAGGRG